MQARSDKLNEAIDWDITGQIPGEPICDLLRGALRTRIPIYQSWGATNLDQAIDRMAACKAKGV
jgi:L-alanine-DL-glutamate epimerase-like enolase superfamily enzyme